MTTRGSRRYRPGLVDYLVDWWLYAILFVLFGGLRDFESVWFQLMPFAVPAGAALVRSRGVLLLTPEALEDRRYFPRRVLRWDSVSAPVVLSGRFGVARLHVSYSFGSYRVAAPAALGRLGRRRLDRVHADALAFWQAARTTSAEPASST